MSGTTFDKSTDECVTPLGYCENRNGTNATYDSASNSCGCAAGYELDSNNTCVDGYQICNEMNATWDGTSHTSSGGFSCTCKNGYVQSYDGKTCVVAPIKTGYQVCSESYSNMTWDGTYDSNGKYNCVCQTGYTWNSSSQSCY
jgi:hypothetical protein